MRSPTAPVANLVEFRFIAVSIFSKSHLLDARRAASTSPRNLSSDFALRRLTLVSEFFPLWASGIAALLFEGAKKGGSAGVPARY
jgi:hypothetical protein